MRLALGQVATTGDKAANLATVCAWVKRAAEQHAELIIFPEATMQAFGTGPLYHTAEPLDGPFVQELARCAQKYQIGIIAGIFTPPTNAKSATDSEPATTAAYRRNAGQGSVEKLASPATNTVANVAVVCLPDGRVAGYEKIHTYDAFAYRESEEVTAGQKLVLVPYQGVTIGLAICYDLRFPEMFRELARRGAEVIIVPVSWAEGPGKAMQRHVLAQARALDSTSMLVVVDHPLPPAEAGDVATDAANTAAASQVAPTGIGESMVIAANGEVLARLDATEQLAIVDIDPDSITQVRAQLPVLQVNYDYAALATGSIQELPAQ